MKTRTHTTPPAEKKASTAKERAAKQVPKKKITSESSKNAPDIQSESVI